jgi:RNA recognition motif-containing protein
MKLLIRNLARSTTEDELRKIFEVYGTVQSCDLVLDKETGESKGFGFIEMPNQGDAKAAMKRINGEDVAGSKVRVKKAESKSDAPIAADTAAASQAEPDKNESRKAGKVEPGESVWNRPKKKMYDGKKGKGRGKGRGARS